MKLSKKRLLIAVSGVLFLVSIAAALWGINHLREQQVSLTSHRVFLGRVAITEPTAVTNVILWDQSQGGDLDILGSARLGPPGLFAFLLRLESSPNILAYSDQNANGVLDADEPFWTDNISSLPSDTLPRNSESARDRRPEVLNITLTINGKPEALLRKVSVRNAPGGSQIPIAFGEVSSMDDARLGANYGISGLWRTRAGLTQRGIGVYALEEIDRQKTPIIFIHGAGGSPQDFATMISATDTSRIQSWVFSYPSGLPLSAAADALARITIGLAERHQIPKLHMVAHSMGGLVARRALENMRQSGNSDLVQRFVSISTPFGGHEAASQGVKHSPIKINSWFDLAPGSKFLNDITAAPALEHHLLVYGTKASKRLSLPDENDGVVSVQSQLFQPVKAGAEETLGFELDHRGILESELVIDEVFNYLNAQND